MDPESDDCYLNCFEENYARSFRLLEREAPSENYDRTRSHLIILAGILYNWTTGSLAVGVVP